jgi:hypothetical protein
MPKLFPGDAETRATRRRQVEAYRKLVRSICPEVTDDNWADGLVRLTTKDPGLMKDERVRLWLSECEKRIERELNTMSPGDLWAEVFSPAGIVLRRQPVATGSTRIWQILGGRTKKGVKPRGLTP